MHRLSSRLRHTVLGGDVVTALFLVETPIQESCTGTMHETVSPLAVEGRIWLVENAIRPFVGACAGSGRSESLSTLEIRVAAFVKWMGLLDPLAVERIDQVPMHLQEALDSFRSCGVESPLDVRELRF